MSSVAAASPMFASPAPGGLPAEAFPLGQRLLEFAREQLKLAWDHLGRDGDDRHVGIHQARKSIRRARATIALGRRTFGWHAARLDEDLGRLCRGLSALRDAQALIEELTRLEATAVPEAVETLALAKVVARQRRDEMLGRVLKRDDGLKSRRQRLLHAQARLKYLDWNALDERTVLRAVERSRRRAAKAGPRAERRPDDEEAWHVYRRRMRRLHQQHTLLATIQPGLLPPTMGLDAHAGALGEFQDDVLLLRRCKNHSPFPAQMRPLLRRIARERLRKARRG